MDADVQKEQGDAAVARLPTGGEKSQRSSTTKQGSPSTNGESAASQEKGSVLETKEAEVPHSLDSGSGSGTPGKAQADTNESETTSVHNCVSVKSEHRSPG